VAFEPHPWPQPWLAEGVACGCAAGGSLESGGESVKAKAQQRKKMT